MVRWKLILDGAIDGVRNMAIDSEMLDEVDASVDARTIVRFYSWVRPTLSLGRNQKVEAAADCEYCRSRGIDIVHRPTGGRAVLHDDELTYSVASNDASCFGDTIYGNYKRVSEALQTGFHYLGVAADLAPDTKKAAVMEDGGDPPCFVSPSRYELMVDGRKIAGSAQRRLRRSFLQHGSMPLTVDRESLAHATRLHDVPLLERERAGIAELLPVRPTFEEMTNAFVRAFQ